MTLPEGPYDVIVADPPWAYQKRPGINGSGAGGNGIVDKHYPTMTVEQLTALPVSAVAAPDAHLFLWVTNPYLYGGRFSTATPADLAAAWGFAYKTMVTWVKTTQTGVPIQNGMGWFFRGCTEHVLYATRGKAAIPSELREPNVLLAPRGRHSEKPVAFLEMIERITTGRRLELFARTRRLGWDAWGSGITPPEVARP